MRRIALVLPIRFAFDTRAVQTTTRDLSLEGVFVRCLESPPLGTQVSLRLYLPGVAQASEFVGVVREAETGEETGFWAEFITYGLNSKERLTSLLFPQRGQAEHPVTLGAVQTTRSATVADEMAVVPRVPVHGG